MPVDDSALTPSLFGLTHSNKDFLEASNWGKNQFNNTFPTALICYMYSKGIKPVYIVLNKGLVVDKTDINSEDLFGTTYDSPNLYFNFESGYEAFQSLVETNLPRIDLVTQRQVDDASPECLRALEIKLTTLPDNSTCDLTEDKFSTEIVVRPDTIVYLAASIALDYKNNRSELLGLMDSTCSSISNWRDEEEIKHSRLVIIKLLNSILLHHINKQSPLLIQPVWKTQGKSVKLSEHCLDVFVWSDYAFTRLFVDTAKNGNENGITRHFRSVVWLIKMLYDFSKNGRFNHDSVINELSYNTRNDKAFACSGLVTHFYLSSPQLLKPRIKKSEINKIILGDGQNLLSPERRLDAVIQNTPDLF